MHPLQTSYRALMNQATQERAQTLHSEQDSYRDVTSLSELLLQLNLEHYESCFEQEEVDLDTFLTMTESDLKEVGVTTLGARRKLKIAISGMCQLFVSLSLLHQRKVPYLGGSRLLQRMHLKDKLGTCWSLGPLLRGCLIAEVKILLTFGT